MADEKPQRRIGKRQFLAHKEEIGRLIAAGWSTVAIWDELTDSDRLSLSYAQFTRYVRVYFKETATLEPEANKDLPGEEPQKQPESAPDQPKSFGFKPYDPSDKDNLI